MAGCGEADRRVTSTRVRDIARWVWLVFSYPPAAPAPAASSYGLI